MLNYVFAFSKDKKKKIKKRTVIDFNFWTEGSSSEIRSSSVDVRSCPIAMLTERERGDASQKTCLIDRRRITHSSLADAYHFS